MLGCLMYYATKEILEIPLHYAAIEVLGCWICYSGDIQRFAALSSSGNRYSSQPHNTTTTSNCSKIFGPQSRQACISLNSTAIYSGKRRIYLAVTLQLAMAPHLSVALYCAVRKAKLNPASQCRNIVLQSPSVPCSNDSPCRSQFCAAGHARLQPAT